MRIRTIPGASILAPRVKQSGPVVHCSHAFLVRAVSTTIKIAAGFHTMADYFAPTVLAFGSECVNGAFETIKVARDAIVKDFQRLIVFISTNFTLHKTFSCYVFRIPGRPCGSRAWPSSFDRARRLRRLPPLAFRQPFVHRTPELSALLCQPIRGAAPSVHPRSTFPSHRVREANP